LPSLIDHSTRVTCVTIWVAFVIRAIGTPRIYTNVRVCASLAES